MKICRICTQIDASQLLDWNCKIDGDGDLTYVELFQECTQLMVSNHLLQWQWLCHNCASELKFVYAFLKKAKNAEDILRQKSELDPARTAATHFEWVDPETLSDSKACLRFNTDDSFYQQSISNEKVDFKEEPLLQLSSNKYRTEKVGIFNNNIANTIKPTIVCEYCNETFSKKQMLCRHIARYHKTQLLLCHACPRTFNDATALRLHCVTHDENRERKYSCEHCDRKFYTKRSYQTHGKTHASNRQATFECDQCEKSFFHKGSLKLHKLLHSGNTLECKMCQKRYIRRIDLDIHLRSHSGDTPYKCSYCDKAFTQVGILNKHVRHHEGYHYKCDMCSKEYRHQSTLIQHRKEHTGLPLKCAICDKAFVKKSKMRRHIEGVHKIEDVVEMDKLIIKVKTIKTYRGRILEVS